ncbi:MAG: hypothetical protein V1745_00970 [Patescibacteria group bacterium]
MDTQDALVEKLGLIYAKLEEYGFLPNDFVSNRKAADLVGVHLGVVVAPSITMKIASAGLELTLSVPADIDDAVILFLSTLLGEDSCDDGGGVIAVEYDPSKDIWSAYLDANEEEPQHADPLTAVARQLGFPVEVTAVSEAEALGFIDRLADFVRRKLYRVSDAGPPN